MFYSLLNLSDFKLVFYLLTPCLISDLNEMFLRVKQKSGVKPIRTSPCIMLIVILYR